MGPCDRVCTPITFRVVYISRFPRRRLSCYERMTPSPEQFQALAMEQVDVLYRVARRMVRDEHTAEDLVQETYLRAFRSADSFKLEGFGIRPWLIRIMHNLNVT